MQRVSLLTLRKVSEAALQSNDVGNEQLLNKTVFWNAGAVYPGGSLLELDVLATSVINALMMEAADSSETSADLYQYTRRSNPEVVTSLVLFLMFYIIIKDNMEVHTNRSF